MPPDSLFLQHFPLSLYPQPFSLIMSDASVSPKASIERRSSNQNLLGIGADKQLMDKLLFAVPKKGRLHDQCIDLLAKIGLKYRRKPRLDIAMCTNLPIALVFLPASDIPRYIADSHVDLGITGEDMIAEKGVDVKLEVKLGFGKCRLCLQAPVPSAVTAGEELLGKRVITSFPNLSRKYFSEVIEKSGAKAEADKTQVTFVSGSVEVACGLGLADGIVDLVESGDTMVAHNLMIVDTLMSTQAVLVSNTHTSFPQLIKKLNRRIEGVIAAKNYKMIAYNIEKDMLEKATELTPGQQAPTVQPLVDTNWFAVQAMVKTHAVHDVCSFPTIYPTKITKHGRVIITLPPLFLCTRGPVFQVFKFSSFIILYSVLHCACVPFALLCLSFEQPYR